MKLVPATPADAATLALVHAKAFDKPWPAGDFESLIATPGMFCLLVEDNHDPLGMILCRLAVGEAEVLTIGVAPAARRQGVAQALMAAALGWADAAGATEMFLEVAVDNEAAVALYDGLGFEQAGRRRGYYARPDGRAVDAWVMRLDLRPKAP